MQHRKKKKSRTHTLSLRDALASLLSREVAQDITSLTAFLLFYSMALANKKISDDVEILGKLYDYRAHVDRLHNHHRYLDEQGIYDQAVVDELTTATLNF